VLLYAVLFRHLRLSSPMIKVVATIGLLVAIPSLATLIFGNQADSGGPRVWHRSPCRLSDSSASR
jgi:branched-chain amino acid transport system permease protein